MYFQLLRGVHVERGGRTYQAVRETDKAGRIISEKLPVVESDTDLVRAFGPEKFRALAPDEARILLAGGKAPEAAPSASGAPVEAGGTDQDVTGRFPKAAAAGLSVTHLAAGGYIVADAETGEALCDEPLKSRIKVHQFVKAYTEQ